MFERYTGLKFRGKTRVPVPRGQVNLNECEEGDILVCVGGVIARYICKVTNPQFYSRTGRATHLVQYLYYPEEKNNETVNIALSGNTLGTRSDEGFVFMQNILETDADVLYIISKDLFNDAIDIPLPSKKERSMFIE